MQTQKKPSLGAKALNLLLLLSFVVTLLVPLTGVIVHKMASALFLLLCVVHAIVYRKSWGKKGLILMALVVLAFLSGLFGLMFEDLPLVLALHKVISIGCVFLLAIHIFIYRRKLLR